MAEKKLIKGSFHSKIRKDNAVAWCKFHKCAMTPNQIRNKECLKKGCRYLLKYENHRYWEKRKAIKELRKLRKEKYEIKN